MTFEEIQKSIKATLYERTASPLVGSFILSWLAFNWRIPYFILIADGNMTIDQRINRVDTMLHDYHHSVLYPLLGTLFFVVAFPVINYCVYWLSLIYEKWRYDAKLQREGKKLLSLEKAAQLRLEMQDLMEDTQQLLDNKQEEVNNAVQKYRKLAGEIDQLKKDNDEYSATFEKQRVELEETKGTLRNLEHLQQHRSTPITNLINGSWCYRNRPFNKELGEAKEGFSEIQNFIIHYMGPFYHTYNVGNTVMYNIDEVTWDMRFSILAFRKTPQLKNHKESKVVIYKVNDGFYRGFEFTSDESFEVEFRKL